MKPITIEMTYEKSTKNTHVYTHVKDSPIPTLYIKKSAFNDSDNGTPGFIKVVISDE